MKMKPLFDLFPEFLRKQPQKDLPLDEMVRAAWVALVGQQIASRSHVFRLYNTRLQVNVPDSRWQKQLHRMEQRLLSRINGLVGTGRISGLDFRVDPSMTVTPQPAAAAAPPRKAPGRETAPPATDADVERSAQAIADPALRELFLRTSRRMLK